MNVSPEPLVRFSQEWLDVTSPEAGQTPGDHGPKIGRKYGAAEAGPARRLPLWAESGHAWPCIDLLMSEA